MTQPDLLAALAPVVTELERLGVAYSVVGSVASSAHGIARASLDADLVADLAARHIDSLVTALQGDYYIERDAVTEAVSRRSMFNVVHLATMLKVDVYVLTARPFDVASFGRRRPGELDAFSGRRYALATAEDTVLHKLGWYRDGGDVSERQWGDVVGVLKVQGGDLDVDYMHRWAVALGVDDLLQRAIQEAGS
ncbi:MAG: hypothetical protein AABZ30_12840 [Myxococcota bacterium]